MPSRKISLAKLHSASVPPQRMAMRNSRHRIFGRSCGSISPTAMPRMMVEVLWLPALPPASVSMGMYAVSTVTAASASSYPRMTMLEKVALIIRNSSHGARLLYRSHSTLLEVGLVGGADGVHLAISSLASSCMIEIASSIVTIPTRRFSLSTTGMAR